MRLILSDTDGSKVLSGTESGKQDRDDFTLDFFDRVFLDEPKTLFHITVVIPEEIYSVNSSYFLALFGPSIRRLGEEKFRKRYVFQCSDVIRDNCIEPGIRNALKSDLLQPDRSKADNIWDLNVCIAKFIYPKLKEFKESPKGCPMELTPEEWDKILDKMIRAFEAYAKSEGDIWEWSGEEYTMAIEGLNLFGKWFFDLWI